MSEVLFLANKQTNKKHKEKKRLNSILQIKWQIDWGRIYSMNRMRLIGCMSRRK